MGARTAGGGDGEAVASPRAERLHRSSDVRAAFAGRGASGTSLLVVHGRRRPDVGPPRATVVAGRKVGNAVARNRVKRRLRSALEMTSLPSGFDLVVVGRRPAAIAPFPELRHALETAVTNLVQRC